MKRFVALILAIVSVMLLTNAALGIREITKQTNIPLQISDRDIFDVRIIVTLNGMRFMGTPTRPAVFEGLLLHLTNINRVLNPSFPADSRVRNNPYYTVRAYRGTNVGIIAGHPEALQGIRTNVLVDGNKEVLLDLYIPQQDEAQGGEGWYAENRNDAKWSVKIRSIPLTK